MQFSCYDTQGFCDEMFDGAGSPRPHARLLLETVESLSDGQLLRYKHAAERLLLQMGITFNVYGDSAGTERIFPFDLIPRIVPAAEWDHIERGLKQRVHALNAFIDDIYHDQNILRDGIIPREVILSAVSYRKQCHGLNPPWRVWCHVAGIDLVRDRDGLYYVLEDNLRVPSGVSYVLENREVLKTIFLVGGQMAGDSAHRLFLVYPEGNWVEVGPDTPYQIIGASGFGKPILERSLTRSDSLLYAFKVGLLAFDATRLCAADVGFPMDVILYSRGAFALVEQRYEMDDLRQISAWWQERMRCAVHDLPSEWIEAAFSKLTRDEVIY